jgi:peroxiredoxin
MLPPTTQNKLMILGLLVILVSSPIALSWFFYKQSPTDSFPLGTQLPSLTVSTLNGTRFSLNYQGKKHILIFFTSECLSCRSELSNLDLLYTQFKSQVEFFAISLSKKEKTKILFSSEKYSFPFFLWKRTALKDSMKIVDIPTIFFIDEQRIIRHVYVGDRTLKEDKTLIRKFCKESFKQKQ